MITAKNNIYLLLSLTFQASRRYFHGNKSKRPTKSMSAVQNIIRENKAGKEKARYPPGQMYLSVLGNGSSSSPRALYMFTDNQKYLFNCGEGTQRLANEHKMKLSKLQHIFITHKSWDNFGGLLGLSLTLQDMGVSEITIHGPPETDLLYGYTEPFVLLPNLSVDTRTHEDVSFKDDCMEVIYVPIYKSTNRKTGSDNESEEPCPTDEECFHDMTMAFVCKGHSRPGRILMEKCVEYGVPVGPLLKELKSGEDITLPSGKVVHSKDVLSKEEVCPIFLVVECPSEDFLDPFVEESRFCPYQEDATQLASLVVHFTPAKVVASPLYQKWIHRFPPSTHHLLLNEECDSLSSGAVHRIQHHLNLLHPHIFPLLQEEQGCCSSPVDNVIHPKTLERYFLRPATGLDRSFALKIDPQDFLNEVENLTDLKSQLKILQDRIKNISNMCENGLYPEITFLGTGSCLPNKGRNVSAILVNSSANKYMLMDCGEGTHGQLQRMFREQLNGKLLQLFCIFISHMHADHHLGLIKILNERQKLVESSLTDHSPVCLVGPADLDIWLKDYYDHFEDVYPMYSFIDCSELKNNPFGDFTQVPVQMKDCKDIKISTVPVIHCGEAYGVIISSKSPKWKLVYSGDTMPSEWLISAGKGCSVLIHEATMEDELAEEAEFKRHSTTSQALEVGRKMGAAHTILTHFSQRYAKVPLISNTLRSGCAFDNMTVNPSQFPILPLLLPALTTLFAESIEELQTKGEKRRKRQSLKKSLLDSAKKLCTS